MVLSSLSSMLLIRNGLEASFFAQHCTVIQTLRFQKPCKKVKNFSSFKHHRRHPYRRSQTECSQSRLVLTAHCRTSFVRETLLRKTRAGRLFLNGEPHICAEAEKMRKLKTRLLPTRSYRAQSRTLFSRSLQRAAVRSGAKASVHKLRGSLQLKPLGVGIRVSYVKSRTPLQCQGVGGAPRSAGSTAQTSRVK